MNEFRQWSKVTIKDTDEKGDPAAFAGKVGYIPDEVCGTFMWVQLADVEPPTRVLYHASTLIPASDEDYQRARES
jgi:hypothetical protein